MRPDFSPAMLRLFLHARCRHAHGMAPCRRGYQASARRMRDRLRRRSGVTAAQMEMAWMGRLQSPPPRALVWAALGFEVEHDA